MLRLARLFTTSDHGADTSRWRTMLLPRVDPFAVTSIAADDGNPTNLGGFEAETINLGSATKNEIQHQHVPGGYLDQRRARQKLIRPASAQPESRAKHVVGLIVQVGAMDTTRLERPCAGDGEVKKLQVVLRAILALNLVQRNDLMAEDVITRYDVLGDVYRQSPRVFVLHLWLLRPSATPTEQILITIVSCTGAVAELTCAQPYLYVDANLLLATKVL